MNNFEKLHKIELLEQKLTLHSGLPHLYGFPFYKWAREFFDSTNKFNFLCSGNQLSKSSTQIRKAIHWATYKPLWPTLWLTPPQQFWYLYPNQDVVRIEVTKKWVPEFLPRGEYRKHPIYGWELGKEKGDITAIHFNSGVSIFFRTYSVQASALQASSPHAIFCDEELPFELFPELSKRLLATDGHFHMVFTATLGQEEWRETIEERGQKERFKEAAKWQISLIHDCRVYEDGSLSPWTDERITRAINSCSTEAEVNQRIHGKFVVATGKRYESFSSKNIVEATHPKWQIGKDWVYYSGVDIGSGGQSAHPAAIHFVAVSPDYKRGIVFRGWRGSRNDITTASDILEKLVELRGNLIMAMQTYDYASKDFYTIATRAGESFVPADKARDSGDAILNTLFKNDMLVVYDIEELYPLISELKNLKKDTVKMHIKREKGHVLDDAVDSLRYAVTRIPWAWDSITGSELKQVIPKKTEIELRREIVLNEGFNSEVGFFSDIEAEIEAANEWYEI